MKYYSQIGQDKFIDELFNQKRDGIFIDIGAFDGMEDSNSLFFEETRNWTGICIEPSPLEFNKLNSFRKSININACVSDYDGKTDFVYIEGYARTLSGIPSNYDPKHVVRIQNDVRINGGKFHQIKSDVFRLQTIIDKYLNKNIDFCSIDTEGSELKVLESIDFAKTSIQVFAIENNFQTSEIKDFLEKKNYILHAKIKWDDIFVSKSFTLR
jgi:FkbM family methyltransferase